MTRDLVEKTVTEVMSGALKYCDTCEPGSARHHQYQVIKQIFFHPKIFWVFTKREGAAQPQPQAAHRSEGLQPPVQASPRVTIGY